MFVVHCLPPVNALSSDPHPTGIPLLQQCSSGVEEAHPNLQKQTLPMFALGPCQSRLYANASSMPLAACLPMLGIQAE